MIAELRVTLKYSVIGRPQNQRDTAEALGLTKISSSVIKPPNGVIKGIISTVPHLVNVEEV